MSASKTAHTTPKNHVAAAAVHSELEETEDALQQAIESYHFLANTIPQQVWTARPDGSLDYVNDTVATYFGQPAEKVIGDGWQEVLHPDDLPSCIARWTEALQTGTLYEIEFRLRRADGTYRWHLGRALPQRDEDGDIIKWFGTNTDIHDQKQAREALQEQTHALQTIQKINNAIASELDQEKLVQVVTDAGTELSGAQFGAFFYNVIDAEGESLMLYTISGVPRETFSQFPMPRNTAIFSPTFKGEGVVRIEDVTQDSRYGKNAPYHGMPEGHLPVRSYLAVPVLARDNTVIGSLIFGHPDPGVFTKHSEEVVLGIAAQAAVTLENARLYQQAQADLGERTRAEANLVALNETLENQVAERTKALTSAIGSLQAEVAERQQAEHELHQEKALVQLLRDVAIASNEAASFEAALQFAIDYICDFTGWSVGHAYVLIDEDGIKGLYPSTIWHLDDPERFATLRTITEQTTFSLGSGLPGRVWKSGKPSWIRDLSNDPDFIRRTAAHNLGVKAGFAFPVGRGEHLQAILEFFSEKETEPDKSLQEVMAHIGDQVSQVALRLETQQALAQSQQLLDGVLNNAKDGIMALEAVRDDAGEIVDFKWLMSNPAASQLSNRPEKDVVGTSLLEEVPDIREMGLFDVYKQVVETDTPFEDEMRYADEFIEAWFAISAVKLGDGVAITFRDVTEQKIAERELAQSQQLLDGILGSSKDGIAALKAVHDDTDEIVDFVWLLSNPAAAELVNRSQEDLIGSRLKEVFPGVIETGLFEGYKQVTETDSIFEKDLFYADHLFAGWFAITAVKLGDGITLTFRNITERKEAEEELIASESQLNRAQAIAHIGSWEWDIEQGTLTWSDELYRIYGLTPGAGITFETYAGYIHPEDQPRVQSIVEAAMASKESFSFFHRLTRPDGEERIVRGDGEVVADPDGKPLKMFGTAHDVTEQRVAERELAQSQQLLDGILSNAPDGIMALEAIRDDAGEIVDFTWLLVNPAATEITHHSAAYYVGKQMMETIPHIRSLDMFEDFKKVVEEDITLHREQYYQRDEMDGWFASNMVKLDDGLVVIFRDITERKEAEQKMERINEKLEQRNRELQDFAYVASHDLQEPLRKIRAFADLLEEDYGEQVDENGQYYMDRMRDAATRMSRLLTDLLAYSRVTTKARPFEEIDLNQVANEVLSDLELQISEAEGSVKVAPLPTIDADPTQMHQLLQNFISNALKFTAANDRPIVRVQATLEHENDPGKAQCRLEVSDNGIGFDEKYLDRIFTPFQRLHGRGTYAGTGMGLAICRRIVERHQGTLTAQSTPGNGATFIVTLPVHHQQPQPEQ